MKYQTDKSRLDYRTWIANENKTRHLNSDKDALVLDGIKGDLHLCVILPHHRILMQGVDWRKAVSLALRRIRKELKRG